MPADDQTAHAAGLAPVPPELVPAPAPVKPKKETKP
ncbi:MAG: hypothetical protein YHS30scaffold667_20 [Phage 65_10]|nr:MAG: hypothetical protein YHS30scaffold667_20 [Phage 65_10]